MGNELPFPTFDSLCYDFYMNSFIIGIRFQKIGKVYHFDASNCRDIQVGDFAVVDTSRGRQLGEVVQLLSDSDKSPNGKLKSIHHKATPRDLVLRQIWQKKELEAMINCRAKVDELKIEGVKIVAAEYTFDGSRLSLLYSTEGDSKVDLRDLRKAMQRIYTRPRVEMRQIGPRDVAKLLAGMGACGLETRCCSMFLTEFSPISIRMAKAQGISLTPSEITGMCGRLRCCLIYEYEQYAEARKGMPKRNKRVETPKGEGKVIDHYPLKGSVVVLLQDGQRHEFPLEDVHPWEELQALRAKAQEPCAKHPDGGCNCGRQQPDAKSNTAQDVERGQGQNMAQEPQKQSKRRYSRRSPGRRRKKRR